MSRLAEALRKLYAGLLIVVVLFACSFPFIASASIGKVVVLTVTAKTSWTVPDDFNSYDNSVEVIGGGGGGGRSSNAGAGGGAGGESWSRLSEQFFRVDKWSLCRG